jgi:putative peptidoglycan lipid II flippase
MSEEKSILKPTIQITFLSFIGIILNFATQLVIAYFWGTTPERDAYFAAIVIPAYLSSILVGSIGIMFLPIYVDIKTKKSFQQANVFFSHVLAFSIVISIVIIILFSIFADNILSLTTPGFKDEQSSLTSDLLIILLPTILFQIVINVIGSFLQVQHKFVIPALNLIFNSIISLLFVIAFRHFWGIKTLAYGVIAGNIIVTVFLLIHIRKSISFKRSSDDDNGELHKLLKASAPLLITGIFYRLTGVFERGIGSTLSEGSISYLGYANQIMLILSTLTTSGIAITIYPLLSKAWSENDNERLQILFDRGICIILLMTLPISIIFIFWGTPIIQILLERGAFTHASTIAVSATF